MKYLIITFFVIVFSISSLANDDIEKYFSTTEKGTITDTYDPGYVKITLSDGTIVNAKYRDIAFNTLYDWAESKSKNVLVSYSMQDGCQVKDIKSNKTFSLYGVGVNVFIDRSTDACIQAGNHTTLAMRMCTDYSYYIWDAVLNRTYKALGGNNNEELKKAQLKWIMYRDQQQKVILNEYSEKEGTIWPYILLTQRVKIIKNQTELLQSILEDK